MKLFLAAAILLLPAAANAQTVYGKLLQELDSFQTDGAMYVKGGLIKLPGQRDSMRISGISTRLYSDRTIVVAQLRNGRQVILDDGKVDLPVSPRIYSRVLYAGDSTLAAAELFRRCVIWMGKYYASGTPIDVRDQASGVIITKPVISGIMFRTSTGSAEATVSYTITVQLKQGRIKIDQDGYTVSSTIFPVTLALNAESKAPDYFVEQNAAQQMFNAADGAVERDNGAIIEGLQQAIDKVEAEW